MMWAAPYVCVGVSESSRLFRNAGSDLHAKDVLRRVGLDLTCTPSLRDAKCLCKYR